MIARQLYPVYSQSGAVYNNSWLILEHVTGKKKEQLIIDKTVEVCSGIQKNIAHVVHQVVHDHMPLQYITERVYFMGLELVVRPPVLIPRPETEEWLYTVIEQVRPCVKQATSEKPFKILDLCTGSGCIALGLAHYFGDKVRVVAIDNASHALELASINAEKVAAQGQCTFVQSDLYQSLPERSQFDLIVTNPPYIRPHEFSMLDPQVLRWEDRNALVSDDNGLGLIKRIVQGAPQFLRSTFNCAQLWCEIGFSQGIEVAQLFKSQGFYATHIIRDINEKDRVVCGKWRSGTCGQQKNNEYV